MEKYSDNNYDELNSRVSTDTQDLSCQNPDSLYETGIAHLQKGKYLEASDYFKKTISISENYSEAHYHLGYCYQFLKKFELAIEEYQRTLELNPLKTAALNNSGVIFTNLKKFKEAEKCFKLVLKHDPSYRDALINFGNFKLKIKEFENAIELYSQALITDINNPVVYFNIGNCYLETQNFEKAIQNFETTLTLEPQHQGAINNLGLVYYKLKKLDISLRYFNKALELFPKNAICYLNIGNIYRDLKKYDLATLFYKKTLEIDSGVKLAYVYIADVLCDTGKSEEAEFYYNLATGDKASKAFSFTNLSLDMMVQRRFKEALRYCNVALTVDENIPEVHYNKSHIYLLQENFEKGWAEYEWRLKRPDYPQRNFKKPFLQSENIDGKIILVIGEQGLGDSIQFVRYLPMLKKKGAVVIFECNKQLTFLFKNLKGIDKLVEKNENKEPEFKYDYHIPLLSLPFYFGTTIDNIPKETKYIYVTPSLADSWEKELLGKNNFRVGIVWAGSPTHTNDKNRSCSLEMFLPFLSVPGVDFYSLQKGSASNQANSFKKQVIDIANKIQTLEDTAAIISNLDLVITIDSSIAHLAGSLGKSVWVLIPFLPDWRWMLDRTDSPWYPTMKLFRQQKPGQWNDVVRKIKNNLEYMINHKMNNEPLRETLNPTTQKKKLFLGLSEDGNFGWGIVCKHLKKEVSNEIEIVDLSNNKSTSTEELSSGKVFQILVGINFDPLFNVRGKFNYGYTVFENELNENSVLNSEKYDKVIAASTWSYEKLITAGIKNADILIQGIDPKTFYPGKSPGNNNLFVIYSGGKFEIRKSQDLIIKAISILQKKHKDIILINSWYNAWQQTMKSMSQSKFIKYEEKGNTWEEFMLNICKVNDLDSARVFSLPLIPNKNLREVYLTSDIGLFPNRCEGGTNLIMMEYMACGKPVIASFNTGHKDILSADNSIMLEKMKEFNLYNSDNRLMSNWEEPDLDEIIDKIEYAYNNRDRLKIIGEKAAEDMKKHSWSIVAKNLIKIIS